MEKFFFYSRGPNKYTRNWADEDAYGKTAGNVNTNKPNKRINKTGEEFPALGGSKVNFPFYFILKN